MSFVIPAIDLKGGKCVQLQGGDPEKVRFSAEDPLQAAMKWAEDFDLLHVIDLDAALGRGSNLCIIKKIAEIVPVQVGGGIRTIAKAKEVLDFADRIIIGTNTELIRQLSLEYGKERIVLAVDSRENRVSVRGWTEQLDVTPNNLARKYRNVVGYFLYTCIDREGRLSGPDLEGTQRLSRIGKTIASGGVASITDIRNLESAGADSVVIGSALYTGRMNMDEVIGYEKSKSQQEDKGDPNRA